jgi:hypothetical protein
MSELDIGERDVLCFLQPDTLLGALAYLVLFVLLAMLASRARLPARRLSSAVS